LTVEPKDRLSGKPGVLELITYPLLIALGASMNGPAVVYFVVNCVATLGHDNVAFTVE
jgi:hypothetical protein